MTKRLGRGLAELIESGPQLQSNFVSLKIAQIRSGRFQPREGIRDEELEELKRSIKRQGVIEPVIVRPLAHGTYELVAGERRWRAAQALGLTELPAIVKTLSDQEALECSLVENIQRENLNPVEEAKGFARLLEEFGYTQEDIAEAMGKDRATVANLLRLLRLPEEILQGLRDGRISAGHAKMLVSIEPSSVQLEWYQRVIGAGGMTVRQLEAAIGAQAPGTRRRGRKSATAMQPIEDELRRVLGTKVTLVSRKKGGRLVIDYFSSEDLTRILQLLGVST